MTSKDTGIGLLIQAAEAADAIDGLLKVAVDPFVEALLNKTHGRPPNASEIAKGVPPNFSVKEVKRKKGKRIDKYFYAPDGRCFRSIKAIVRWKKKSGSESDATIASSPMTDNPMFRTFAQSN